jgi:hypothetical protein
VVGFAGVLTTYPLLFIVRNIYHIYAWQNNEGAPPSPLPLLLTSTLTAFGPPSWKNMIAIGGNNLAPFCGFWWNLFIYMLFFNVYIMWNLEEDKRINQHPSHNFQIGGPYLLLQ